LRSEKKSYVWFHPLYNFLEGAGGQPDTDKASRTARKS
jgi:hypothetical protein